MIFVHAKQSLSILNSGLLTTRGLVQRQIVKKLNGIVEIFGQVSVRNFINAILEAVVLVSIVLQTGIAYVGKFKASVRKLLSNLQ